ncbi:DeoR/GlpR family DNA-binding transcription regulator [Caulobacter segnis]|nr:DeoR/GlpR family DNA-binding transcription regulator [Caulobacter segnis]
MWAEERQQQILTLLNSHSRVEADALAARLNVSRETIRRDLKQLEAAGLIRRTHGGALVGPSISEQPFRDRLVARIAEKEAIAAAAVDQVKPGDCCFIDAGSTTSAFAKALASVEGVSVITNSLDVAVALRTSPAANIEVLLLGGSVGREAPATYGVMAIEQAGQLRADLAFISPVGIDPVAGASYFDLAEADMARIMLKHARRRVVLADASKCNVVSRMVICPCSDIDVLISDLADPVPFRQAGVGEVIQARPIQSGQAVSKSRRRS